MGGSKGRQLNGHFLNGIVEEVDAEHPGDEATTEKVLVGIGSGDLSRGISGNLVSLALDEEKALSNKAVTPEERPMNGESSLNQINEQDVAKIPEQGMKSLILDSSETEPQVTTPPISRRDLLDIVRKHSDALPRPGSLVVDTSDGALMDGRYWREMLDMFFVRGWGGTGDNGTRLEHDALFDDMLFFVRQETGSGAGAVSGEALKEKLKPYFVRRWTDNLSKVVGQSANEVDWRRSFYLNLICHTAFTLTVAICSRQALDEHRKAKSMVPPITKVTKRVYASPSKARIDMDAAKAREQIPAYPDICFAIDDYDDSFEAVVLSDADHCFCVLLNAHGGASFPPDDFFNSPGGQARSLGRRTSSEAKALGEDTEGTPKVTLFSGFVSYAMVRAAFQGGRTRFGVWGQTPAKAERLVMRGPGGRGEADVAVSGAPEPLAEAPKASTPSAPKPPLSPPNNGAVSRLPDFQARLFSVQEELMKLVQTQQEARGRQELDEETRGQQEKEYQEQLQALQEELKTVQQKLQALQARESKTSSPPRAAQSPAPSVGGLMKRAAEVATKQVVEYTAGRVLPLRCCLMALSLPWDSLSYDLLFKEMPMKVDITGHIVPRRPGPNLVEP